LHIAFLIILAVHVATVAVKLAVLFYIPRLKDVAQIQQFLGKYKKMDRWTDYSLWVTGILLFATTSWRLLLQRWLLLSMLIYSLVFVLIKVVLIRRLEWISSSRKIYAKAEIGKLQFENWCVGIVIVFLMLSIGALMMTKPSF
jgi:hypothetical protein